jgi:hypothetical protein
MQGGEQQICLFHLKVGTSLDFLPDVADSLGQPTPELIVVIEPQRGNGPLGAGDLVEEE